MKSQRKSCPYSEFCNAPLCPLDEDSLKNDVWYADEEICKRRDFADLLWIKNQKKIAKKTNDFDTYYTFDMLNRKMRIAKNISGLNPDKDEQIEKKKWFENHKELSKSEIEKLKERGRRLALRQK